MMPLAKIGGHALFDAIACTAPALVCPNTPNLQLPVDSAAIIPHNLEEQCLRVELDDFSSPLRSSVC